jgi:hypothetical protein
VKDSPLLAAPVVAVSSIGAADGARGAAAALACAGSDPDRAGLLVEVGGRPPRPTLLASAAAQRFERRLAAHLPKARVAARGSVCHLAATADQEGLEAVSAAVAVARDSLSVIHLESEVLRGLLDGEAGPSLSSVLLCAEPATDRALLALAVGELIGRGLAVAVLKRRLGWVVERRALFGAIGPETPGGLPPRLTQRLLPQPPPIEARPRSASPS